MASPGSSEAKRTIQVLDFEEQNYEELKRQHLREKSLFIDPKFPANGDSIRLQDEEDFEYKDDAFEWKRPKEICKPLALRPRFIHKGMARTDVVQGIVGDCWFMAAAASLTMKPKLLERVVPQDQSFDPKDYAGIFHFRFWQLGKWVDVVVDDQLPCLIPPGENLQLAFGKSEQTDEFWMALLEKACAKLKGSYGAIHGGYLSDALVDLTGGITEIISLHEIGPYFNLCKMIRNALRMNTLMAAGIEEGSGSSDQLSDGYLNGLQTTHTYTITGVQKVTVRGKKMKLVRLRNPWGHKEWKGDWSDDDVENWSKVDPEEKKKLLVNEDDGEFWMDLRAFLKVFDELVICYLSDEAPKEKATSFRWYTSCFHGRWKISRGDSSSSDTLRMNPQFYISLRDPDEDSSICTLISLMQRRSRNEFLEIGIAVYKVTEEVTPQVLFTLPKILFPEPVGLEGQEGTNVVEIGMEESYSLGTESKTEVTKTFLKHQNFEGFLILTAICQETSSSLGTSTELVASVIY